MISIYTYNEIRRMKNEAFDRGEKCGIYMAIDELLEANGAPKPHIIQVIEDPEVEVTYIVENGR